MDLSIALKPIQSLSRQVRNNFFSSIKLRPTAPLMSAASSLLTRKHIFTSGDSIESPLLLLERRLPMRSSAIETNY